LRILPWAGPPDAIEQDLPFSRNQMTCHEY
jgi:hypothetical protein